MGFARIIRIFYDEHMKKGGYQGEQNPASEANVPTPEGLGQFSWDKAVSELLAAQRLVPEKASLQSEFDKSGKVRTVTIRDKETGKVIFFSDSEFFRKTLQDQN